MAASVPERCPQCRSPVAERFPHAVMYDCGCSLFNDGQPVTDDYPAECQRRRIKRLEKQLAAARAEAERWKQQYEALLDEIERLQRERQTLLSLLRQVDVVMDGAALSGVGDILAPRYRDDWALVHTRVRERLALLDGEGGGGA